MTQKREFHMIFTAENDAFQGDGLVAESTRILGETVRKIALGDAEGVIFDVNGNRVGQWTLDRDD